MPFAPSRSPRFRPDACFDLSPVLRISVSSNSTKAATKRRAAPAPKRAPAVNNKPAAGKRGKKAAVEEPLDEEADESDEVVQETQEDDDMDLGDVEPASKKAAAGRKAAAGTGARAKAPAKKGKAQAGADDDDGAEGASTVKEKRLQAKLDAVRPLPSYERGNGITDPIGRNFADQHGTREDHRRV